MSKNKNTSHVALWQFIFHKNQAKMQKPYVKHYVHPFELWAAGRLFMRLLFYSEKIIHRKTLKTDAYLPKSGCPSKLTQVRLCSDERNVKKPRASSLTVQIEKDWVGCQEKASSLRKVRKSKAEMFGHNAQLHVWRKPNTSYKLSSKVVEGWRFGLVLQPRGRSALQSLSQTWKCFKVKCETVYWTVY